MKVKIEVDLTPKEMLELFEGNIESLQKAMLKMMMQTTGDTAGGNNALEFWQTMAQKSQEMFEQYQKNFKSTK